MPSPFDSLLQGKAGDRLDPHEALHQRILITIFHWSQGQPAVAHDDRRNPVLRFAGPVGVPKHLGVQMGVMIDKSRRDRQSIGVNGMRGATL